MTVFCTFLQHSKNIYNPRIGVLIKINFQQFFFNINNKFDFVAGKFLSLGVDFINWFKPYAKLFALYANFREAFFAALQFSIYEINPRSKT